MIVPNRRQTPLDLTASVEMRSCRFLLRTNFPMVNDSDRDDGRSVDEDSMDFDLVERLVVVSSLQFVR